MNGDARGVSRPGFLIWAVWRALMVKTASQQSDAVVRYALLSPHSSSRPRSNWQRGRRQRFDHTVIQSWWRNCHKPANCEMSCLRCAGYLLGNGCVAPRPCWLGVLAFAPIQFAIFKSFWHLLSCRTAKRRHSSSSIVKARSKASRQIAIALARFGTRQACSRPQLWHLSSAGRGWR